MFSPGDLLRDFWEHFDVLPVWAKLVIYLFGVFLLFQGFKDSVLGPTRRSLSQFRLTLVRIGRQLKKLGKKKEEEAQPKRDIRELPPERTIWEQHAPSNPIQPLPTSIPIITVANMKGGVGKTTISANLALALRDKLGGEVLLIDFDYQGSLSQCVRGEVNLTKPDITADYLILAGAQDPFPLSREMFGDLAGISLYPTTYPFATIENRLLVEWLAAPQTNLMYRLCEQLRRPEFQQRYKAVIIDSPPRLTPGSINALCASTHLLVPTTLDDMSAQAATYFLDQVSRMKGSVFPGLRVLGVVPSMVYQNGAYLEEEADAVARLKKYGSEVLNRPDFLLEDARLFRRAAISRWAGKGVAYLHSQPVRALFQNLAEKIQAKF
ncbi:MAG: ParA family protein [Proteobacteria bacterium]|nr:ParA family protein [Pseudomonadota bacterium]